jgi:MoaA/NifB/PqqE/SkfB family radical SAM enzyme
MCSIWRSGKKYKLSLEQIKALVDGTTPGLCYLSFSGGEPLLVPDLFDMIHYAVKRIPFVHCVSNGMLLDSQAAQSFQKSGLSELSISLDGSAAWHNKVRGNEQSFEKAVDAIELMRIHAPDVSIVVNSVLFPDHPEEVLAATALTKKLGVKHKIQPVNTHFTFDAPTDSPNPIDFSQVNHEAIQQCINALSKDSHIVNSRAYLTSIPFYFKGTINCPMIKPFCELPEFFLEVSSQAKISPCLYATGWESPVALGDNVRSSINSSSFKELKHTLKRCRMCNKSMFICYWEPLITFPLGHFFKYKLRGKVA